MKRKIIAIICVTLQAALVACTATNNGKTMPIAGVEYPEYLVKSGYYYDKASFSDIVLGDMLSKVEEIEKPKNLGTVELPDFSTITLTNNKASEIDSAVIEAELERERDGETTYDPVKIRRAAALKDKVIIDFKGFVGGEELQGGAGEDYELVLGSGQFIPGFEEKVAGHMAGRKFTIDVTFPTDYDPSLAGKDAKFEIIIKSIEEPVTPEVDEEFVKKHTKTNSTTVEEYKEEVKKRIEKRNEFMNNQNLIYQLSEALFEKTKFNPTEEALAWQFSVMISQYNEQAKQSGTNLMTMITQSGENVKDFYSGIKSSAAQAVQSTMLMDELEKRYPEKVTDNDIIEWFDEISDAMGYGNQFTLDDYKQYVGYDNLKKAVEQEKTLLKVAKKCNIVDEKEE